MAKNLLQVISIGRLNKPMRVPSSLSRTLMKSRFCLAIWEGVGGGGGGGGQICVLSR